MVNDVTMAGTSMLTDIRTRNFSERIMSGLNFPAEKMGTPVEAGTITGKSIPELLLKQDFRQGIPVVATGHDTQFAIFGSGAEKNQPVLSSGTWEVLMVRSEESRSGREQMETGITTELDSRTGII